MEYYTTLTDGRIKVDGERLQSDRFPDFDFFYYTSIVSNEGKEGSEDVYYICELRSGFSVGDGKSFNEAKIKAIENFKRIGIERTREILNTVLDEYGRANIKRRNKYGRSKNT